MLPGLHKNKQRLLCSALILGCFSSQAQDTQSEQAPSMALLEYLAELEEVDGELVGPMDMSLKDKEQQRNDSDEHDKSDSKIKQPQPQEDKPCVESCSQ